MIDHDPNHFYHNPVPFLFVCIGVEVDDDMMSLAYGFSSVCIDGCIITINGVRDA
jgi:hypothetical protein